MSQLPDKDKIHQEEIDHWFTQYPDLKPADKLLAYAQQIVIDGKHVVRVPIATNSAIYLTKVDGVVKTYLYKWLNQKPGADKYTGIIITYSFQDNQIRKLSYTKGTLTESVNLGFVLPTSVSQIGMKNTGITFSYVWGAFLCWLNGGSFDYIGSGDDPNNSNRILYYYECHLQQLRLMKMLGING